MHWAQYREAHVEESVIWLSLWSAQWVWIEAGLIRLKHAVRAPSDLIELHNGKADVTHTLLDFQSRAAAAVPHKRKGIEPILLKVVHVVRPLYRSISIRSITLEGRGIGIGIGLAYGSRLRTCVRVWWWGSHYSMCVSDRA